MNSSPRRLDAEDLLRVQPGGRTLFEAYIEKVVAYLKFQFKSQLSHNDCHEIALGAILTAARSGIDPEGQPVAYIKTIASNDAKRYLKASKKEILTDPTDLLGVFGDTPAEGADPADLADSEAVGRRQREDADLWEVVDPAIGRIKAWQQREVMRRQSLGHEDDQISAELNIPKNQIYQQRHRGAAALRTALMPYIRSGSGPSAPAEPGEQ